RPPRCVAARAPRRAGVAHLPRCRALLSPALRRRTWLGGRAHRRAPGLEGSGVAGPAGLSRGGAAPAPAGDRRGHASHPPAKEILMRVIDMECSIPKNENTAPAASPATSAGAERPAGYGMANYRRIFRPRAEGGDARPTAELARYVEMLGRAGIVRSVPFGVTNDELAGLMRVYPDRFIGLARISGLIGMKGVRELERRVREEKF